MTKHYRFVVPLGLFVLGAIFLLHIRGIIGGDSLIRWPRKWDFIRTPLDHIALPLTDQNGAPKYRLYIDDRVNTLIFTDAEYNDNPIRELWFYDLLNVWCVDFCGDERLEVVFSQDENDSLKIKYFEGETISDSGVGNPILFTVVEGYKRKENGVQKDWIQLTCVDVNGDGQKDMVASVFTFVGKPNILQPRGIIAYDGKSGKEIWHRYMGPAPAELKAVDITGDGIPEILCKGVANCNGSEAEGTSDTQSYIFAFDLNGQYVWSPKVMEHGFSDVYYAVKDINNDGQNEIVVAKGSQNPKPDKKILILDGKTGNVLKEKETGSIRVNGVGVEDLDSDGKMEIIVVDFAGNIKIYDQNLRLLRTKKVERDMKIYLLQFIDVDFDGTYEILYSTEDNLLCLVDKDLNGQVLFFLENFIT